MSECVNLIDKVATGVAIIDYKLAPLIGQNSQLFLQHHFCCRII